MKTSCVLKEASDGRDCSRRDFLKAATLATAAAPVSRSCEAAQPEPAGDGGTGLFWGDLHTHTALSDGNGTPDDNFQIAKSHLDFWAMTDHAFDDTVFSLDYRKFGKNRRLLNEAWPRIQEMCREYEDPGRFIPFLGYEWTNFRYGHHNVYYLDYDQPIRMPATLPELYDELQAVQAMVIPHHPGYPVGVCGKDWRFHDPHLSPLVEIYSLHGSSETSEGIRPLLTQGSWMGPGEAGGCVQAGLARGHRFGMIASSDSHADHPGAYDLGLIAAQANDLSRRSLWEAFQNRRVYATTGDRIQLNFSINGQPMGSTVRAPGKRTLRVNIGAWDRIDRVEMVKNNAVFHSFVDPVGEPEAGNRYRMRFFVEWGWDVRGEHAWKGRLTLSQGTILQAIPCYRGKAAGRTGTGIVSLSGNRCEWTSRTEQARYDSLARRFADAAAFEVQCPDQATLKLEMRCDAQSQTMELPAHRILRQSAVRYMEKIPPTNDGAYWHNMATCAKFKVHQGWPTNALTVSLTCEDDSPSAQGNRSDFYYVRVIQRNGQRAWSSPIWVEHT